MRDLPGHMMFASPGAAVERPRAVAAVARAARAVALPGVLLLAGLLRAARISEAGFGQMYYSAGVRGMMASFHNFLFNSFDPAGFVSLDKPPVALWAQVISSDIVGFSPLGVHLPQVLEGVASVLLLNRLVTRRFGALAGLLAALFLAVTPISVAVDRSTNTDSCLVLTLLIAAWAMLRAVERASLAWLLLAMALVGLAFNVKMLAAFVVLPAFCGVYLLMAPTRLGRRARHLIVAAPVLAAVALAWVGAYDLVPAADRPYAGSSAHNSMLELAVIHNGVQRFVAPRPGGQAGGPRAAVRPAGGAPAWRGVGSRVPAGPLRLLHPPLATQFGWLLPLAAIGCGVLVVGAGNGWPGAWRSAGPRGQMLALFGGWALTYAVVLSAAAGIFHAYYTVTLAAPVAGLAGIGAATLWRFWRAGARFQTCLPLAIGATALWQVWIGAEQLIPDGAVAPLTLSLLAALLGGAVVATGALLVLTERAPRLAAGAVACGIAALCVLPGAWSVATAARGDRPDPLARLAPPPPAGNARPEGFADTRRLVAFTRANNRGETFLFATPTTRLAAPVIVASGEPVMAMGGFSGSDPIVTPDSVAAMAARGDLRFVLFRDGGFGRGAANESRAAALQDWLAAHGAMIDPTLWHMPGPATTFSVRRGQPAPGPAFHLYDLRPELGLVPAADGPVRGGGT